jgi:hypothetical protein
MIRIFTVLLVIPLFLRVFRLSEKYAVKVVGAFHIVASSTATKKSSSRLNRCCGCSNCSCSHRRRSASSKTTTTLNFYPDNFGRATECATGSSDLCDLDELDRLSNEMEEFQKDEMGGMLQGHDHYEDTQRIKHLIDVRRDVHHIIQKHIDDDRNHQPATFDMSEIF